LEVLDFNETTIALRLITTGITGTPPITYAVRRNNGGGPMDPINTTVTNVGGSNYTAGSLTPSTEYRFVAVATNAGGETLSEVSVVITMAS
jgi:hypothetical protein